MNRFNAIASPKTSWLPNGPGAAAILSAGIGCFAVAVLALIADKLPLVKSSLVFYQPTGPLSGVTTIAICIWLLAWRVLAWRWRGKTVSVGYINAVALALLGLGLILTFPPVVDLF
ncbi:MAG: hypothetical protein ABI383_12385 [Acidobacteriaceae bacterium]